MWGNIQSTVIFSTVQVEAIYAVIKLCPMSYSSFYYMFFRESNPHALGLKRGGCSRNHPRIMQLSGI